VPTTDRPITFGTLVNDSVQRYSAVLARLDEAALAAP
jgi:hypothetical protein